MEVSSHPWNLRNIARKLGSKGIKPWYTLLNKIVWKNA
jgi:hypothetical protein